MDYKKLKFAKPTGPNGAFHIIGADNRSLCGNYGMFGKFSGAQLEGHEEYLKGQDCKSCFKKAKLKTE